MIMFEIMFDFNFKDVIQPDMDEDYINLFVKKFEESELKSIAMNCLNKNYEKRITSIKDAHTLIKKTLLDTIWNFNSFYTNFNNFCTCILW